MIQKVGEIEMDKTYNSASAYTNVYTGDELTALLERLGVEEVCPKGTYLFNLEKPKMPDIILLKHGTVKACQITVAGEEHIYNLFREGATLFLLAAITNEPPALNFVATTPCKIIRVSIDAINKAIEEDGRLARTLLNDFGRKLTFSYKRLRECESYNTEWKVCNMLLSMAGRSGVDYEGKTLIREKVSQQTMAGMLRVSRITVARTLKVLRDLALIETVNGYICIRDESALLQHMHYISIPLE